MKTIDFFHKYGRIVDVAATAFGAAIDRAVERGWLTADQGYSLTDAAASDAATAMANWKEGDPTGYLSTDSDNPLQNADSPCAKIAALVAALNKEPIPATTDFPETPQGEGQRVSA